MAFGDIGGAITELVVTCRTALEGSVAIKTGDPVRLCGPYTVTNTSRKGDALLGQSLADCTGNDQALPIKIRGIAIFPYTGDKEPDYEEGDAASNGVVMDGSMHSVKDGWSDNTILSYNTETKEVHVLL